MISRRFGFILLNAVLSLSAQVTEAKLKSLYSSSSGSDAIFTIKSGIQMKAVYGANKQACLLIVPGTISEQEVFSVFDTVVPPKLRGPSKLDLLECVGACQRNITYNKVVLTTGAVGQAQTSDPAALITFNTPDCEPVAKEAKKIVLRTQTTKR